MHTIISRAIFKKLLVPNIPSINKEAALNNVVATRIDFLVILQ
jgi:hypothetical protein